VEGGMPKKLSEATEGTTHMFPCWSPDGKTIAFVHGKMPDILSSMSAIKADIYTVPVGGGKPSVLTTVSDGVKFGPIAWSPDGNRIYYRSNDQIMAVDIETSSEFSAGKPEVVFTGKFKRHPLGWYYDLHPDGDRFVMLKEPELDSVLNQIKVIRNFAAEIESKFALNR